MKAQKIEWIEMPYAVGWDEDGSDTIVWIEIARIDAAWAQTDQYIVQGGANGQDGRYQKVGEWFAKNTRCYIPCASFDHTEFCFTDGRHRFSWLRDQGLEAMPLQTPRSEMLFFKKHFGSKKRQSILQMLDQ